MNVKVSIIVPIYNTAKFLPVCLNSILHQTYENLEIVLIDDGSTDESSKIVDTYAKKDSRVKVVHQKNAGQSAARNRGLKLATGKYISFIDSDDEIKPTFIESLLSDFSETTALSMCGFHYKRLRAQTVNDVYINPLRSKRQNESFKAYILYLLTVDGRLYSSVNKLYRADIAKTIQFDETINFAEDTKFVLDYLKKFPGELNFVLEPLYIYNYGTTTSTMISTAVDWQNWENEYQILKTWLGKNPSFKENFWLHAVRLRWRVSCFRSKRRAKQ